MNLVNYFYKGAVLLAGITLFGYSMAAEVVTAKKDEATKAEAVKPAPKVTKTSGATTNAPKAKPAEAAKDTKPVQPATK